MATFEIFYQLTQDILRGVHDFDNDTFKCALSNTAPGPTNAVFGDITEIASGSGYTAGGGTLANVASSRTLGVTKVSADDEVFTASGTMAAFRYAVVYNDTPSSPADPLLCYYDYGSAITLSDAETFTVDFDDSNGIFDIQEAA